MYLCLKLWLKSQNLGERWFPACWGSTLGSVPVCQERWFRVEGEGFDPRCLKRDQTSSYTRSPNKTTPTLTSQSASSAMQTALFLWPAFNPGSILACGQTKNTLCRRFWWRNVCRLLVCLLKSPHGQKGNSSHTQMKLNPKESEEGDSCRNPDLVRRAEVSTAVFRILNSWQSGSYPHFPSFRHLFQVFPFFLRFQINSTEFMQPQFWRSWCVSLNVLKTRLQQCVNRDSTSLWSKKADHYTTWFYHNIPLNHLRITLDESLCNAKADVKCCSSQVALHQKHLVFKNHRSSERSAF